MKPICRLADTLYGDFFGLETDALYEKLTTMAPAAEKIEPPPEPEIVIIERMALKVPRELLSDVSEAPPTIGAASHEPLPMGEPAPWRSAAAAWEQIGEFDPSHREKTDGYHAPKAATEKPRKASTWSLKEKHTMRIYPVEVVVSCASESVAFACSSISATAFAIATVYGCRFPIGDPKSPNFHFCNKTRAHGSYCKSHNKVTTEVIRHG
jgi:GcrA cell cycle regulator